MHREHTLDSKQGTNMADLGRKYKDDSIIVKSTFVSVFPYIFNILDVSKRSCRKRSVQKTSGDYLQWECHGGRAGQSHDPAVFVLMAGTARCRRRRAAQTAHASRLFWKAAGLKPEPLVSQRCIIDAETIYTSLNGN